MQAQRAMRASRLTKPILGACPVLFKEAVEQAEAAVDQVEAAVEQAEQQVA